MPSETDLSLLAGSTSKEDIAKLQERGDEEKKFILRNDEEKVWAWLTSQTKAPGGVDFVLDNAGFELFTDLVFADFLISFIPSITHATIHPKSLPWFVSDVMPRDFAWLLETLSNPQTLFPGLESEDEQVLKDLGARWTGFVEQGKFRLQEIDKTEGDFWVRGEEYQVMPDVAPKLADTLKESRLVVFKGDLKYVHTLFKSSRFLVLTPPPLLFPSQLSQAHGRRRVAGDKAVRRGPRTAQRSLPHPLLANQQGRSHVRLLSQPLSPALDRALTIVALIVVALDWTRALRSGSRRRTPSGG